MDRIPWLLNRFDDTDGKHENILSTQHDELRSYPFTDRDQTPT